jgi:vanillate O-demethylase monooxygenase subunit
MYHGLRFDRTGCCVEIPSQDHIPPQAKVATFPVFECCAWVWIWTGRPDLADPAQIPDTSVLTDPKWRGNPGYLHYDANYLLIADNLLDFSHLSYVHEKTLGGSAKYAASRPKIKRIKHGVRIERWVLDDAPAPFLSNIKSWPGNVDRWNIYDFLVPGILLMNSGSAPTGTGAQDGVRVDAAEFVSCQAITPESETSTHYFFQQSHSVDWTSPAITAELSRVLMAGFEEDRTMILAQQRSLIQAGNFQMLGLRIDSAIGIFRSHIEKLLAENRSSTSFLPDQSAKPHPSPNSC